MANNHIDHDQEDKASHGSHDDCQDCRRERAQNDALISIYQKLQQVDKKTADIKSSISIHQQSLQQDKNKVKQFDGKVTQIKHNKNNQEQTQFQQLGYHLYASLLENNKKSQFQKQNQRLKLTLKNIYKQPQSSSPSQKQTLNKSLFLPHFDQSESTQWFTRRDKSSRIQNRNSDFNEVSMGKSFEIFSTKSSFNTTKRKIFNKEDFEDLNLWLFDNKNELLQKQLYEKRIQEPPKLNQTNTSRKYISVQKRNSINNSFALSNTNKYNISLRKKISGTIQNKQNQEQNSISKYHKQIRRGSVLPAISRK